MTTYNVSSGVISNGVTLNGGDLLTVFSGGVANATNIRGGFETVGNGGVANGTVISAGADEVDSGGLAVGTVVGNHAQQSVSSGGVASGTVVNNGGSEFLYAGVANGTTVGAGGTQQILSGGTASNAVVNGGGTEYVNSGGQAVGTTLTGGTAATAIEYVFSAATARATQVANGGALNVFAGGVLSGTTVASGGFEYISSGGVANGTVLNGGVENIVSGGTATNTVVNLGGSIDITYLGFASGGSVNLNQATGELTVVEGGQTYQQQLSGSYAGEDFRIGADSGAGTLVTVIPGSVVLSVTALPASGDLVTAALVTITVTMSKPVTVSGGTPSLGLNDGGNAIYDPGKSNGTTLVFDYTVQSGQSTAALAVTGFNLNGATVVGATGTSANFAGTATTFSGLEINIPPAVVTSVLATPATGDAVTGAVVTVTVTMTRPVTVSGGIPDLALNDGGTATYDAVKSGGTALVFDYTVQSGDSTNALAVTGFNLNGATVRDSTGVSANLAGAVATFNGLEVNVQPASVASVVAAPATGDAAIGTLVTLTVTMTRPVTVSGGTPGLSLNDGGGAVYDPAKSSGAALVFDYTVQSGQSTNALAVTGFNLNGATVADAAGISANLGGAVTTFSGLEVNVQNAAVASVVATPAAGDAAIGALVTLTITMTRPVTVSGGTPGLTLNDGASAIYDPAKSSGTVLVFDYTVQPGQSTAALAVTGFNPNGATVADTTGATANLAEVVTTFSGLEVNVAPTITGALAGQAVADTATIAPFRGVTVADPLGGTDTVTVTPSSLANGGLSGPAGGVVDPATGVYTVSGSAAAVTSALDGLVFTPTAHQAPAGQVITTNFTINVTDTAGASASDQATSVVATETSPPAGGLLGVLNFNQQLELIYVAYFGRAADSGGFTFWQQQNVTAQTTGQSAAVALTNIANSFAPQPETEALYPSLDPYLVPNAPPLNTPAGQTALNAFIASVYGNLFGHAPDAPGEAYWVGQLTSGAVGIGAAALAIANGAIGADAIEVQNKIAVSLDFTTRTGAAVLGETVPLTASFKTAATTVLTGVDGISLNDASVTAAKTATTTFISGSAAGQTAMLASGAGIASPAAANDPITFSASSSVIDPGMGDHTIQFLAAFSGDTLILHAGGVDQIYGFNSGTDKLDLRSLLREANVTLNGDFAALGNYLTVVVQGANAVLDFDPAGHAGGSAVAVLHGPGGTVTALDTLVAQGAIRIS